MNKTNVNIPAIKIAYQKMKVLASDAIQMIDHYSGEKSHLVEKYTKVLEDIENEFQRAINDR